MKDKIPYISNNKQAIGYWHWIDNHRRLFFAGVLVYSLSKFERDSKSGLCSWNLGKSDFAVFKEKNGEEGTIVSSPAVFKEIDKMGYRLNYNFNGEFFVYPLDWIENNMPQNEFHEIWIPIIKK